jgi:hypothetical protein
MNVLAGCRSIAVFVALSFALSSTSACIGLRVPLRWRPYGVRLLGADDGGLRIDERAGRRVFTGTAGRDYAIEVTNETKQSIAFSIVIDGLDAITGVPEPSCEALGSWSLPGDGRAIIRGFSVAKGRIATYRFAPPERSLAAIAKGGRRQAIGTIEVCIFSLRPRAPVTDDEQVTFRGVIESDEAAPTAPTSPAERPPVTGELRDEPVIPRGADVAPDRLLERIVVAYEDEDGAPLGTAPPPAGIARVERRERVERGPRGEPSVTTDEDATSSTETKPTKAPKPTKPTKQPKPTKGTKEPPKG